jgi:hypothetical protein
MIRKINAAQNPFSFKNVQSNMCMRYEDGNTTSVLAVIQPRGTTAGRKGPPECCNGFNTSGLPFAKGHIIALEIGGSDDPYNIVPQFEKWQGEQGSPWRNMEIELSDWLFKGQIMRVDIEYGRSGAEEPHSHAVKEFKANRIRNWQDPRIPSKFSIWVYDIDLNLAAINTDVEFNQAIATLSGKGWSYFDTFDLGEKMPEPDRSYYVTQFGLDIALDNWDEDEMSFASYLLEPGVIDDIRDGLDEMEGVTPTEAQGMQVFPILYAGQRGVTKPKIRKKVVGRKKLGRKTVEDWKIGI